MEQSKVENSRDELLISLGKVINSLRNEKNMTLKDLSQAIGKSPSYLSELENGKYSSGLEVYKKIADALGTKLYRIIFRATGELNLPKEKTVAMESYDSLFERMEELADNLVANHDDDDDDNDDDDTGGNNEPDHKASRLVSLSEA